MSQVLNHFLKKFSNDRELHDRTGVPLEEIQNIVLGNVVPDVGSNNVARDAALMAGYPPSIPAHSVNMACMSSILSITTSETKAA